MSVELSKIELEYHELPADWAWIKLSEVCNPINGRAFKSSDWKNHGLPIIRIQNLKNGNATFNYFEGKPDEKHLVRAGDLLFAWSGTPGTSFGAHIWNGPLAVLNQHIFRIEFDDQQLDPKYFLYALNQNVTRYVQQAQGGVGLAHITKRKFLDSQIPIGPITDQKKIVAEIEKQFSRLDEAVISLKRAKANLKRYKAAVLKAAIEGKLTEEWRKQHPDVEPASELLKRSLTGANSEPNLQQKDLDRLPAGWLWVSLDQVVKVATGATPLRSNKAYYESGSIPWITSSALNNVFISEAREYITEKALKETNVKLFPVNTLLIAMYGEGSTRGKVSELLIEAGTNQACAAIIFSSESEAIRPYLKLFFQNNYEDIRLLSAGGVQPNLNLGIIKKTVIPIPPLEEQRQILKNVEHTFSVAAVLEEELKFNFARCRRLRESILRKAFSGQVEQV